LLAIIGWLSRRAFREEMIGGIMPVRRHQRKPEKHGVSAWDGEPQLIFRRC
jgi:hypothetical protein